MSSSEPEMAPHGPGASSCDPLRYLLVSLATVGGNRGVVLSHVLERSLDPVQPFQMPGEPAVAEWPRVKVNISELARRTGGCRRRLAEAKLTLVRCRVLNEHADGTLQINPDREDWIRFGRSRPNEALLAYFQTGLDSEDSSPESDG